MAKKAPHRRATVPRDVWTLLRSVGVGTEIVGQFSTEGKAESAAYRLIATESGASLGHPPPWNPEASGKSLAYGRGEKQWAFTVWRWVIDGELV